MMKILLLAWSAAIVFQVSALSQVRSTDEAAPRGDRPQVSVTLRDESGQVVQAAATVKLYHSGMLSGQAATSQGRAFFIVDGLGDYSISVDATGYKSAQKDISLRIAVRDEEDIYLKRDSASQSDSDVPGRPLLAPKAKEAFDKALEALKEEKLDEAQKDIKEAIRLAPNHPDVLYVEGLVHLKKRDWSHAQTDLEKAVQLDSHHARALAALGMVLADEGKFDEAIPPLEQSLQIEAGDWQIHWTLAKAYYHHGQYDDAGKLAQQAFEESHGAAPEIELLAAQCLTAVGKFEESAGALRDYLKNNPSGPGSEKAKRWLARLQADGKIRGI